MHEMQLQMQNYTQINLRMILRISIVYSIY